MLHTILVTSMTRIYSSCYSSVEDLPEKVDLYLFVVEKYIL